MRKFGVKIIPINMAMIQERFNKTKEEKAEEIAKYVQVFKDNYEMDTFTPPYLDKMAYCMI